MEAVELLCFVGVTLRISKQWYVLSLLQCKLTYAQSDPASRDTDHSVVDFIRIRNGNRLVTPVLASGVAL